MSLGLKKEKNELRRRDEQLETCIPLDDGVIFYFGRRISEDRRAPMELKRSVRFPRHRLSQITVAPFNAMAQRGLRIGSGRHCMTDAAARQPLHSLHRL